MAKINFVLRMEVIDIFQKKFYISTIEKLSFHLANVFLVQWNLGRLEMIIFMKIHEKQLRKDDAEISSEKTGIEIQS